MARQTFAAIDFGRFPPASHAPVANTTTRTNLWVPAIWTPIPALDPEPGKIYCLRAGGIISTTGTPTITFNPTFGQSATPASNVALGAAPAITLGSGITNVSWYAEMWVGFRQVGVAASGCTVTGNGYVFIGNGGSQPFACFGGSVPTTVDHTTAQGVVLDVTWSAASASNTVTAQWTTLLAMN